MSSDAALATAKKIVDLDAHGNFLAGDPTTENAIAALIDEAGKWQPIETAPRDGTRILGGYASTFGDIQSEIVHWFKHSYKQEAFYTDAKTTPYWVTHWMPLPAPLKDQVK